MISSRTSLYMHSTYSEQCPGHLANMQRYNTLFESENILFESANAFLNIDGITKMTMKTILLHIKTVFSFHSIEL